MMALSVLDGLRGAMTAPSSKAGNDCDAFYPGWMGQGALREPPVDIAWQATSIGAWL